MFSDQFHSSVDGRISITAEQGSRFAKEIADDFNPIHDVGAKRFCIPGDLLFTLVLARYGLSPRMRFMFKGMVTDGVLLTFPDAPGELIEITDDTGKVCLQVERHGPASRDESLVDSLARNYVAFSGKNFLHYLKPLMAEHQVMFNPERPLVIYESMSFDLTNLDFRNPVLECTGSALEVDGKRGDALLQYRISAGGKTVGTGSKKLVISGLREYDDTRMQQLIEQYATRKTDYLAQADPVR